jgi:hypothetical protein
VLLAQIQLRYEELCREPSDIHLHLPALKHYAAHCDSVLETGVRTCISTWALALGLLTGPNPGPKRLLLNDSVPCDISALLEAVHATPRLTVEYEWCNNLQLPMPHPVDLTFIDTWHVYGQLKRELAKFAPSTRKFILLHDTTTDAVHGESLRQHMDIDRQMEGSGFTRYEITRGVQPALHEFLTADPSWTIAEVFPDNHGLTVLQNTSSGGSAKFDPNGTNSTPPGSPALSQAAGG